MDGELVFPFSIVFVPRIGTFGFPGRIDWEQRLHFDSDGLLEFANDGSNFPKFEMPVIECCPQRCRNA